MRRSLGSQFNRFHNLGCVCILGIGLAACAHAPGDDFSPELIVETQESKQKERRGVLGLFGQKAEKEPEIVVANTEDQAPETLVPNEPSMTDEEIAAAGPSEDAENAPSRKPRLFGFLSKRVPGEVPADPPPVLAEEPETAEIVTVQPSMTDEEISLAGVVSDGEPQPSRKPRLFGFLNKRVSGDVGNDDSQQELPPGAVPFGEVAEVCGLTKDQMGREVARSHGTGHYRLYDTMPDSVDPRVQYISGLKDGCAVKITGALALFGSPTVHEAKRYDGKNTTPYSATDAAYEKVKIRVCGVRHGEFCPVKKLGKLGRDTAFVTVYNQFGDTDEWFEILLHNGKVRASNIARLPST